MYICHVLVYSRAFHRGASLADLSSRCLAHILLNLSTQSPRENHSYNPSPSGHFLHLRVVFATAHTLQYVSGLTYLAAVILVQEPDEAMAYGTLVMLLRVSKQTVAVQSPQSRLLRPVTCIVQSQGNVLQSRLLCIVVFILHV